MRLPDSIFNRGVCNVFEKKSFVYDCFGIADVCRAGFCATECVASRMLLVMALQARLLERARPLRLKFPKWVLLIPCKCRFRLCVFDFRDSMMDLWSLNNASGFSSALSGGNKVTLFLSSRREGNGARLNRPLLPLPQSADVTGVEFSIWYYRRSVVLDTGTIVFQFP